MSNILGRDKFAGVVSLGMVIDGLVMLGTLAVLGHAVSRDPFGFWVVLGWGLVAVVAGAAINYFNRERKR